MASLDLRKRLFRTQDRIFLTAILGQLFLMALILFSAAWLYLRQSNQNAESQIASNFKDWESRMAEAVYTNRITRLWESNSLPILDEFENSLRINGIETEVELKSCETTPYLGQLYFPLVLGNIQLQECIVVTKTSSKAFQAAMAAILIALISTLVTLLGWFVARGRLRSRLLDPLVETIAKDARDVAVGKMASQLAHDIRSPLAALNIVIKDIQSIPESKRTIIRSAVNRVQDIANNLLLKERQNESSEKLSVELLSSLIDSLITEKRTQYRDFLNLEIQFHLSQNSYGIFAKIYRPEFLRVVSNLIDNAVEALPEHQGIIEVSLKNLPGGKFMLEVKDNGKGISTENKNLIFERGFSLGKKRGSGLGLSFAKEVIQKYSGQIHVHSEEGLGSRFQIWMKKEAPPVWFLEEIRLQRGMKVAVADDDIAIHQIWSGRFKSSKAEIEIFNFSSLEDLELSLSKSQNSYDLFLIDYEFVGSHETGLQWIQRKELQSKAVLVTSRFEELNIKTQCEKMGLRLLPKSLSAYVPISFEKTEIQPLHQSA
jgi:signal transduction histidine kinase